MAWQGQRIKDLAKERGLALKDVASQVGVSRQALNSWAKGQVPKGGHLLRLSKTLGVTPDNFFSSEKNARITLPLHRARRTAKLNDTMQKEAVDLASEYELFFREASDPGLVQSLRIFKKNEEEAQKAAKALRRIAGAEDSNPLDFKQTFSLLSLLGVNLVFTDFHPKIKAYAFYTKINNHRTVFVNFETKIRDLIFAILHEAIHSIRDESKAYDESYVYDKEEEVFCDTIASHTQLPDEYISFVKDSVHGIEKKIQIAKLAGFAKRYNHSLHAIGVRIKNIWPEFNINIYPVDSKLNKNDPTARQYFFDVIDARAYVTSWRNVSPVFVSHLVDKSENLSSRRIGELLSIESELDAGEVKKELVRMKNEG